VRHTYDRHARIRHDDGKHDLRSPAVPSQILRIELDQPLPIEE
jgi:hypothetical protein